MNESVVKKSGRNKIKRNGSKPNEFKFYVNNENENLSNKLKALCEDFNK